MRHPFIIIEKLIKKGIALVLLSALTVFYYMFTIALFCYRLLAVTFAAIGTVMTVVDCYKYGFTAERGLVLLFLLVAVALRYTLPLLVPIMQSWLEDLKDYVEAPLTVRSPVRYTI